MPSRRDGTWDGKEMEGGTALFDTDPMALSKRNSLRRTDSMGKTLKLLTIYSARR